MTANKPTGWLLANLPDPAQTVEACYRGWTVTLQSGPVLSGVRRRVLQEACPFSSVLCPEQEQSNEPIHELLIEPP